MNHAGSQGQGKKERTDHASKAAKRPLRIGEGSEMIITAEGDRADLKPVRRSRVREGGGSLGKEKADEIDFAVVDPELISPYYLKKDS